MVGVKMKVKTYSKKEIDADLKRDKKKIHKALKNSWKIVKSGVGRMVKWNK
jgi:hypothetical protein